MCHLFRLHFCDLIPIILSVPGGFFFVLEAPHLQAEEKSSSPDERRGTKGGRDAGMGGRVRREDRREAGMLECSGREEWVGEKESGMVEKWYGRVTTVGGNCRRDAKEEGRVGCPLMQSRHVPRPACCREIPELVLMLLTCLSLLSLPPACLFLSYGGSDTCPRHRPAWMSHPACPSPPSPPPPPPPLSCSCCGKGKKE